ncbi:MAG: hypothetical protein AAAFM81_11750 [Pseudomonadota bacterium]
MPIPLKTTIVLVGLIVLITAVMSSDANDKNAELEAAIELMRAQGMPEARIEEFRRMAETLAAKGESDEAKQRHRENREAEREAYNFESSYGERPVVRITLGDKVYQLKRTHCNTDLDNFSIRAADGEEKEAATFRLQRNATHLETHMTRFRFDHADVYMSLDPAPWNYANGVYSFSGEVSVFTLYGDTNGRSQTEQKLTMTVTAPCG